MKLVRFLAIFALAACSGSTASGGGNDAQGSQGDAGADAQPDYHGTYPAPHPPIPPMQYFGGRVLSAPKIVTVTFAGMDATVRDYVRDFDSKITTTAWWHTVMDGYKVGDGTDGGVAELPDTWSGTNMTDGDVQSYLANQIASGALPAPNDQTIYVIYSPHNALINLDASSESCQTFAGYHGSAIAPVSGGVQKYVYAIVCDCVGAGGAAQTIEDNLTYVASHEIAEASTDPDVNTSDAGGWYMPPGNDAWVVSRSGGENADLCGGQGWLEAPWTVTKVWNPTAVNANKAPCQPQSTPWFFMATPVTVNPKKDTGSGPNGDGYVVVPGGESRDIEVDVWSTQPLPSPLKIFAGRFPSPVSTSTYDPTKVFSVYPGITMSLSQATAVNGDRVTLSISVASTLHGVVRPFGVRAVLAQDDFHTWPVLLYVP